jgi:hypothetical protein
MFTLSEIPMSNPLPPPFEAWQNSAKKGKIFQYFRLGVALHKFQKDFFDSFEKRTRRNVGKGFGQLPFTFPIHEILAMYEDDVLY